MLADQVNTAVRRIPVWLVYTLGLLPAPWFLYLGLTGGLGVEPIKALEHELGLLALQIMVAGLCITPLRRYAGLNLLRFRRALGVLCFTYVALHLLVWLAVLRPCHPRFVPQGRALSFSDRAPALQLLSKNVARRAPQRDLARPTLRPTARQRTRYPTPKGRRRAPHVAIRAQSSDCPCTCMEFVPTTLAL